MNTTFVVYDTATGRIIRSGSCSHAEDASLQAHSPGESVLVNVPGKVGSDIWYVSGGAIVERPTLAFDKSAILADGQDTATLANLPDPCTVLVDGDPHEVAGGRIEMVTTMPGTYLIEIEDPFPYQPFRAEVIAHAP